MNPWTLALLPLLLVSCQTVSQGPLPQKAFPPPGYEVVASTMVRKTSPAGFSIKTHNAGFQTTYERRGILHKSGGYPPVRTKGGRYPFPGIEDIRVARQGDRVFLRMK